jgi:methylenetetrahydrofolate dehydrogenase (NADP+) / methenyltetrahydrofolate cyclohydrolase
MLAPTARIIDGRAVAAEIRLQCKERVAALKARGVIPGLAVIIVGDDPASVTYVRNKIRACEQVGINSFKFEFPREASPQAVLELITDLNARDDVHGILVQLPLPAQFAQLEILRAISVDKDVDGFHLYNVGGLVVGDTVFPPCTPYGVLKLLEHEQIELEGRNVVVVGASNIVGKPMALMLMQRDATVCICHAKTRDLAQFTILADILVVAAGRPNLIVPQMVRTGAVVIDVGINRLPNGKLVGDVDFAGVSQKASYITPVPGGVGPMTVTMLLSNTISAAERLSGSPSSSFISPNERLSVASDSASKRQSLVYMPMTKSYCRAITFSSKWFSALSIFTVSSLCARM